MDQLNEFIPNHWILVFALVFFTGLLITYEVRRLLAGSREIGELEAVQIINREDAAILDVRDDKEYKEEHVANALHAPVGLLEAKLRELKLSPDKPVIVYCRTGERAQRGAGILKKQGYTKVYRLRGGITSWKNANLPVVK